MELSGIVPLPVSVADNPAAAFFPLAGSSPLIRIARAMLDVVGDPRRVVLAVTEPLVGDVRDRLRADGLVSVSVVPVDGAGRRSDCLAAALQHVEREQISTSHVLVHHISRPVLPNALLDRVVERLRGGDAVVIPALPVTDSVKAVDARGTVTATVDRTLLRAVQYPRGFTVAALARLLSRCSTRDFDEFSEAVGAGLPLTVVEGDADAFAADLPRDGQFVEAVIASRRPGPRGP